MKLTQEGYGKLLRTTRGRVLRALLFAVSMVAFYVSLFSGDHPLVPQLGVVGTPAAAVLLVVALLSQEVWLRLPPANPRRGVRQHALAWTYRIMVAAIWLATIVLSWIEQHNLLPVPAGGYDSLPTTVLLYLSLSGIILPTAIVAWIERDDPCS